MSQELLPAVEIKPKGEHKATIIWLHGLGDSGNGFAPIAPELKLPDNLGVKFLFPHAPIRPVTINNGMEMRAWYDIKSMDMDSRADLEGVIDSAQRVEQLIRAEIESGIDASKIMLVGFSQGGVIALHLGARFKQTLAGIVALSTYMCAPQSLSAEKSAENQNTPVFFAHGQQDEVVPLFLGNAAFMTMKENGYPVEWKEYMMQHNVCMPEIEDISKFIQDKLA
ncbi:alpha/beta hydrolase [Glaciecola sp. MF2-115]|uniref:alpha/beta hydrolase n=1 Tax=Glaciecola sp. MF2-115 TaxID=3384827 RepID=UPI0039A31D77